jgi:hypothetical protein
VAQLAAAAGVIASLFYLAAQIRQNTRSMRAIVVDSLAHSIVELLGSMAQQPESLRAFAVVVQDWERASDEERLRAVSFLFANFRLFENAWFQRRQGTLDPEQWLGWDVYIRLYFHQPGVRTWWRLRKAAFAPGFCQYLERTVPLEGAVSIAQLIYHDQRSEDRDRSKNENRES